MIASEPIPSAVPIFADVLRESHRLARILKCIFRSPSVWVGLKRTPEIFGKNSTPQYAAVTDTHCHLEGLTGCRSRDRGSLEARQREPKSPGAA